MVGNGINFVIGGIYKVFNNKLVNFNREFGIESFEVWSLFYDFLIDNFYVGIINKGFFKIDLK